MKILLTSLIGLVLLGCNASDNVSDSNSPEIITEVSTYESNLSKWNESRVENYTYTIEYVGQFEIPGKWEIQVSSGEVIYANNVDGGNPDESFTIENAPTISLLFEDILTCTSCAVTAEFDQINFFPDDVYLDKGKYGYGYTITEFVVQ